MLRLMFFLSIAAVKGKDWLFSMLTMLENISLALTPELEKLNRSEYKTDELDTLATQWSGMWDSVTDNLSFRKPGKQPVRELLAIAECQSRLNIQVVDFEVLSHGGANSSIAQMLACQRNMGDPAAAYFQQVAIFTSLPLLVTPHHKTLETKPALNLEKNRKIIQLKAQEDHNSLLCFFYLIQVKTNEVNYVFCLCSGLSYWRRTYLYGCGITRDGWQRIRP
ncbi:hypothetical protein [Photobacterium gaetbulicola]|uniref:hypothetical protein n=1 Tax=Photobacterium gaetbulicola TaxID=1295392 RepID=UPI000A8BCB5E|nr:hypothetical protein [Photobacterium gaetbulicola]